MKACPNCGFALYESNAGLVCMGCDRTFSTSTGGSQ